MNLMNPTEFNFFEEEALKPTTITELQDTIKNFKKLREEIDELEDQVKAKNAKLDELKQTIISTLQAHNMSSFKLDGVGNVSVVNKYQVSFPKDEENQQKFRAWLVSNGMENMLTVNHQSLNAMFKRFSEEAIEAGQPLSEVIPGVGEPKVFTTVSFRKG